MSQALRDTYRRVAAASGKIEEPDEFKRRLRATLFLAYPRCRGNVDLLKNGLDQLASEDFFHDNSVNDPQVDVNVVWSGHQNLLKERLRWLEDVVLPALQEGRPSPTVKLPHDLNVHWRKLEPEFNETVPRRGEAQRQIDELRRLLGGPGVPTKNRGD